LKLSKIIFVFSFSYTAPTSTALNIMQKIEQILANFFI